MGKIRVRIAEFLIKINFRIASVSEMGKNIAGAAVIVPDSSDGSAPENPYA